MSSSIDSAGLTVQRLSSSCALLLILLLSAAGSPVGALEWSGPPLGEPIAERVVDEIRLQNNLIGATWTVEGGTFRPIRVASRVGPRYVNLVGGEAFRLITAEGQVIKASDLQVKGEPVIGAAQVEPLASIAGRRVAGQEMKVWLTNATGTLEVQWRAVLREGGNIIRQDFAFRVMGQALPLKEIRLIELPEEHRAKAVGTVAGSPFFVGNIFFACEHPEARNAVSETTAMSGLEGVVLPANQPVELSAVFGVVPPRQERRGFLYYVERERAHPYRPFLHYNAWYDLCWDNRKINEQECLDAVAIFARELVAKRQVRLDSFVWDDGWDDPRTLWQPLASGFPNGFKSILAAARECHSALGFWLSPFGGYGEGKAERMAMGKTQGFETMGDGFSLAGAKYYARFLDTCARFIEQDGANFFKFDGLTRNGQETEAMLRLTRALRARQPGLFISITTGTWPSPFWLWYGDSTWRGGNDMGFQGAGSKREQWLNYRDADTYQRVVAPAPLYPLNSLMNQSFAHARFGSAAAIGTNAAEIRHELRSFFASGTSLQELYVTPRRMSDGNWDDLAACARWAHAHADVLVDTHWVGGDPGQAQVYGWASWAPRKGILALRNPSDRANSISLDIGRVFELPARAPERYELKSPWKEDAGREAIKIQAGEPRTFQLEPFEVLVFEATPLS